MTRPASSPTGTTLDIARSYSATSCPLPRSAQQSSTSSDATPTAMCSAAGRGCCARGCAGQRCHLGGEQPELFGRLLLGIRLMVSDRCSALRAWHGRCGLPA
jgi:hypothetical protein